MNSKHRILSLRERGLSDHKIAALSGIPQPTISRIANGTDPRESTATKLKDAYEKFMAPKRAKKAA